MQSAPEANPHCERLRNLARYFRNQERFMENALRNLQAQLDRWHADNNTSHDDLGDDLQLEQRELRVELDHVREAITGSNHELTSHERQLRLLATIDYPNDYRFGSDEQDYDCYEVLGA